MLKRMLIFLTLFIVNIYAQQTFYTTNPPGMVDCEISKQEAVLGPRGVGSLIEISFSATVGKILDYVPAETRYVISKVLLNESDNWWTTEAKAQVHYNDYFSAYTGTNPDHLGQLPFPIDDLWQIRFVGPAKNTTWQPNRNDKPHLAVIRKYEFYAMIVTDYVSPTLSDPRLGRIGGSTSYTGHFPLDPTNSFGNLGEACKDEAGYACATACNDDFAYPDRTGDPAWPIGSFDSTVQGGPDNCKPEGDLQLNCVYFHCNVTCPPLSCVEAVSQGIGLVTPTIRFKRIPYNKDTADQWRYTIGISPNKRSKGADLRTWKADQKNTFTMYKWFSKDAPDIEEGTIPNRVPGKAGGWERVSQFSGTTVNTGLSPLRIGKAPLDFFVGDDGEAKCNADGTGLFHYNPIHGHCHFEANSKVEFCDYNQFISVTSKCADAQKMGFCYLSVERIFNDELTPMYSPTNSCSNQGISAGWADIYQVGIDGQWSVTTDIPTGTAFQNTTENAWGALCEGYAQCDATDPTIFIFEANPLVSALLERPVKTWVCRRDPDNTNPEKDNVYTNLQVVPYPGHGYVTETSYMGFGHEIGPFKDSDFELLNEPTTGKQVRHCTLGSQIKVTCTLPTRSTKRNDDDDDVEDIVEAEVVRICEGSYQLRNMGGTDTSEGVAIPCRYMGVAAEKEELGHLVLSKLTRTASVILDCPHGRGLDDPDARAYEPGGLFALYRALLFKPSSNLVARATCTMTQL